MVKFHPVFVKNQVLTDKQLNDTVSFLVREDRLTRVHLLGRGIVSGLEVRSDLRAKVMLGRGHGVTSAGDVIAVDAASVTYTHRREFSEGPQGYFASRQVAPVWELLETPTGPMAGVTAISSEPGFLRDRIAVLYLDVQDRPVGACVENDCNERGSHRELTRRLLLVTREDAAALALPEDALFRPPAAPDALRVLRPVLRDEAQPSGRVDYAAVVNAFTASILAAEGPLGGALAKVIAQLQPVLGVAAPREGVVTLLQRRLNEARSDARGIQYLYDWMRDLAAAYAELVEVASGMGCRDCPEDSFPRHLLLGAVEENLVDGYRPPRVPRAPDPHRFPFLPSPAVGHQAELRDQAASQLQRLVLLLEKFLSASDRSRAVAPGAGPRMVITPDAGPRAPLTERTIPHYYGAISGGPPTLLDHWSFPRTRHEWQRTIPSYDGGLYSDVGTVIQPLRYDHEEAAFFRIEGHLEQRVEDVVAFLEAQRRTFGLPFNVVAVAFDDAAVSDALPSRDCRPADLEVVYDELREEIRGAVGHEKSFFEALTPASSAQGKVRGTISVQPPDLSPDEQLFVQVVDTRATVKADAQRGFEVSVPEGPAVLRAFTDRGREGDAILVNVRSGAVIEQPLNINRASGAREPDALPYRSGPPRNIKELLQSVLGKVPAREAPDRLKLAGISDDWGRAGKPGQVQELGLLARIVVLLEQTLALLPGDLANVELEVLQGNMAALKQAATSLESQLVASATALSPRQIQLLQHLQVLKSFSYAESIAALRRTLQERQEQQKRRLLFSKLLSEHPSLEHQGGVPRGGTFVLAYQDGVVKADFALSYLCSDPCGPVLLRVPDALPPPKDIHRMLSVVSPGATITVPEATGDVIVRTLEVDPKLLSVTVEDPAGKLRIEARPELFQTSNEYMVEYLIQDKKSGRVATGRVFLTLIGADPIKPPAPVEHITRSAAGKVSIPLAILLPDALPAHVKVINPRLEETSLGAVSVEEGRVLVFQPVAEAFGKVKSASIVYKLRHTFTDEEVDGRVTVKLEPAVVAPEIRVQVHPRFQYAREILVPLERPGLFIEQTGGLDASHGHLWPKANRILYLPRPGEAPIAVVTYVVRDSVTGEEGLGFLHLSRKLRETAVKVPGTGGEISIPLQDLPETMRIVSARLEPSILRRVDVAPDGKGLTFRPEEWFVLQREATILYVLQDARGCETIEGVVVVQLEAAPPIAVPPVTVHVDPELQHAREIDLPLPELSIGQHGQAQTHGILRPSADRRRFELVPERAMPAEPASVAYEVKHLQTGATGSGTIQIRRAPVGEDAPLTVRGTGELTITPQAMPPDMRVVGARLSSMVGVVTVANDGRSLRFQPNPLFEKARRAEVVYTVRHVASHQSFERRIVVQHEPEARPPEAPQVTNLPPVKVYLHRRLNHWRKIELPVDAMPDAVITSVGSNLKYGILRPSADRRFIEFTPDSGAPAEPAIIPYLVRDPRTGGEMSGTLQIELKDPPLPDTAFSTSKELKIVPGAPREGMEVSSLVLIPQAAGTMEREPGGKSFVFRPSELFKAHGHAEIVYTLRNPQSQECFEGLVIVQWERPDSGGPRRPGEGGGGGGGGRGSGRGWSAE